MKRIAPLLLVVAAAAAVGVFRWSKRPQRPNVLLVTFDTTRADRLGCYGYPEPTSPVIDGLARRGIRYADVEAPVPLTLPTHATILTGRYPLAHGLRDNGMGSLPGGLPTLALALQEAGYATGAFVSAEPLDSRYGLDRGFDVYDDVGTPATGATEGEGYAYNYAYAYGGARVHLKERSAERTTERALAWLDETDAPFFSWVHYFDPHLPYRPSGDFAPLFDHPYDAEIRSADHQLGRILKSLEADGRLENTIVIVTSDHGEGLGEHDEPAHALLTYRTTQHVPLVVALPAAELAGTVVHEPVALADLASSLVGHLGLDTSSARELREPGREPVDLFGLARGERPAALPGVLSESFYGWRNFQWAPLSTYREGDLRLISGTYDELFDLATDPGETIDLATDRPEDVARLREAREAFLMTLGSTPEPGAVHTEALLAGPYVSGGGSQLPALPPAEALQALRDPRASAELMLRIDRLKLELAAARPLSARKLAEELIALDGTNPFLHILRARACKSSGDLDAAAASFARAQELDGGNPEIRAGQLDIRIHQLERLDPEEEKRELARLAADTDALLAQHPGNTSLQFNRGRIHRLKGDLRAAVRSYREAMDAGYENARPALVEALLALENEAEALRVLRAGNLQSRRLKFMQELMLGNALARGYTGLAEQDLDAAFLAFSLAVQVDETSAEARTGLARVLLARRELDGALEHAIAGARAEPRNVEVREALADVLLAAGRADEAVEVLQQILEIQPGHPGATQSLKRLSGGR